MRWAHLHHPFTGLTPKFTPPPPPTPFLILPRSPALAYLHLPLRTLTKCSASPSLLETWPGLWKQQFRGREKELELKRGMGAEGVSLPRVLFIQQLSPSGVVSESRTEMLRINSLNKNGQPTVLLQGIAVFDPLDTMLHYHTACHLSNTLIWSRVPSVTNRHEHQTSAFVQPCKQYRGRKQSP